MISDTHGLLRPEAVRALGGVDVVLHAGDIGSAELLTELEKIAPVVAVRGNTDYARWASQVPQTRVVEAGTTRLYLLHDLHDLDVNPDVVGVSGVIAGHSHRPKIERRSGVLYFNPGSAGPRRFSLPVSVGRIRVTGSELVPELITLDV